LSARVQLLLLLLMMVHGKTLLKLNKPIDTGGFWKNKLGWNRF
jgi:hypothetical protein